MTPTIRDGDIRFTGPLVKASSCRGLTVFCCPDLNVMFHLRFSKFNFLESKTKFLLIVKFVPIKHYVALLMCLVICKKEKKKKAFCNFVHSALTKSNLGTLL